MATIEALEDYLRQQGNISESVIKEEASYLSQYEDAFERAQNAVPDYRYRSEGRVNAPSSGSDEAKELYSSHDEGSDYTPWESPSSPSTPTAPTSTKLPQPGTSTPQFGSLSGDSWGSAATSAPQPAFDINAYQAYQAANANNPLSPFEWMLGRQWTDADDAQLAKGTLPTGVTPQAIQHYESGGMQWPGPRPTTATPTVTGAPSPRSTTTAPRPPTTGGAPRPTTQQPQARQVPAQYTDPISRYVEEFAQGRAQRLENPPGDSGMALLEKSLRDIAAQFQQGGYTNGEQEIFQTQMLDPLERLRQERKQQVMHQLSQRGIAPSSGVAIQMLADVDRQFDQMRTQQQADLSGRFAQERVARLLQSLGLLGNLAGSEEGRLDKAFQYRTVPLNLADRAFNQGMQLYGAAGNPLAMVNPLLGLAGAQQGRTDNSQRALADLIWALTQGR
jgi:hypothetical protein